MYSGFVIRRIIASPRFTSPAGLDRPILAKYHKRSNVESAFSMIKRKFEDAIRSKTDTAMVNESLTKVLCHNLSVLCHEMQELGIDPQFGGRAAQVEVVDGPRLYKGGSLA